MSGPAIARRHASAIRDWRNCCFSQGRVILLTVTDSCNQRCLHCMRDARPGRTLPLNLSVLRPAISDAVAVVRPDRIVISGGEPTLVANLRELVFHISGLGVRSSLCTNATRLTSRSAQELADVGLSSATVGIEGIGGGYDEFRRAPGSYIRVMRGIRALAAAGVTVTINVTVNSAIISAGGEIGRHLREMPIHSVSVTSPIITGRMSENLDQAENITPASFVAFVAAVTRAVPVPVTVRTPLCNSDSCPSGVSVFSMNRDGRLDACPDVGARNVLESDSRAVDPLRIRWVT